MNVNGDGSWFSGTVLSEKLPLRSFFARTVPENLGTVPLFLLFVSTQQERVLIFS
jgi:hypothetical protein